MNALLRGTKISEAEGEESFTFLCSALPTATHLNDNKSKNTLFKIIFDKEVTAPGPRNSLAQVHHSTQQSTLSKQHTVQ